MSGMMSGFLRKRFFLNICILFCLWPCIPCEANASDRWAILGLQIGMAPIEVRTVLDASSGIKKRQERMRKRAGVPSAEEAPRVIYVSFEDGRALQVEFSTDSNPRATSITLTYQNQSFTSTAISNVISIYGQPDNIKNVPGGFIMAWGGTAETQGAITPFSNSTSTIRAEQIDGNQLTVTLAERKD